MTTDGVVAKHFKGVGNYEVNSDVVRFSSADDSIQFGKSEEKPITISKRKVAVIIFAFVVVAIVTTVGSGYLSEHLHHEDSSAPTTTKSDDSIVNTEKPHEFNYSSPNTPVEFEFTGLIGDRCLASNHCRTFHAECRSEGVCRCEAGFSFHSRKQTCERDCSEYGNSFQVFFGHDINGHHRRTVWAVRTLEECAQQCVEEIGFLCISCNFKPSTGRCDLRDVDVSDIPPSDYNSLALMIHMQRNCL